MDEQKYKQGYCCLEKKMTAHMKCENKKWVCISPNCSGVSGQSEELPKPPKIKKHY